MRPTCLYCAHQRIDYPCLGFVVLYLCIIRHYPPPSPPVSGGLRRSVHFSYPTFYFQLKNAAAVLSHELLSQKCSIVFFLPSVLRWFQERPITSTSPFLRRPSCPCVFTAQLQEVAPLLVYCIPDDSEAADEHDAISRH